ncbi:hypothetical protein [Streptomyces griseus]|uniref:hypothetical protein n=1 Tax=Streptomyces griseus TaxID=1911 RepID=UPI0034002087
MPEGDAECPAPSTTASSAPSEPADAPGPVASATSTTGSAARTGSDEEGAASETASASDATATDAELPGASEYAERLGDLAGDQYDAYRAEVLSKVMTQFRQPTPDPAVVQPTLFRQPGSPKNPPVDVQPMTELGTEIAARLKEMFHGFSNRQERSQQTTLGPSEIGSPCDRRLAMSLMRMPRVNPGGDGWASFVGTCVHAGLAEMFAWADAGSGRYAVESRLTYDNPHVPKGTTDLIDRVLLLVGDHKLMGKWSRNKLKSKGPTATYRVQGHVYGLFARARGEQIEQIAIIAWPRDESSLDDLYVWTEPYNPGIALKALARVDDIAAKVGPVEFGEVAEYAKTQKAAKFSINSSDCRYCPFYMPAAKDLSNGACNGKQ